MLPATSLYRKWRPTQLDNVVGQKPVVETLRQASLNDQFVHAYLFAGERGTGKTSMARILAKLMTCENVKDAKSCGKCKTCQNIHQWGETIDVKEINGAKNGKVADIDALIESARWAPQELKRKIYTIDECHQLTHEAESNLLKIVEEPPPYLTFIFCTTEVRKIKDTILSRCQRYNFVRLTSRDIAERLILIAQKEQINIDNDAIYVIAKMARGSMRDAISYLQQVATIGINKKITRVNIQKYFGNPDRIGILNIIKACVAGNIALVLDQVNDMIMSSANIKDILLEISQAFRDITVLKVQKDKNDLVDLPDHEIEQLREIGQSVEMSKLIKLAHVFSDIEREMSLNINERWIMEATLMNCVVTLRSK
jgi:DNA polymerase-3 subunit gamma/tau